MPMEDSSKKKVKAWLMALTGPEAGTRYLIKNNVWRIGRDAANDLVPGGRSAAAVSGKHMAITREGQSFLLRDAGSTNGTYVNDKKVEEAILENRTLISLGPSGPRFQFLIEEDVGDGEKTLVQPRRFVLDRDGIREKKVEETHGSLIREAVDKARAARESGKGGQTEIIMREMLTKAVRRSRRNLKIAIALLTLSLIGGGWWSMNTIGSLKATKTEIDSKINRIETDLAAADDPEKIEALIQELDGYQERARDIQKSLLYQLGVGDEEHDYIESEIKKILVAFGAETYSLPPEFVLLVRKYVNQYQGPDRPNMERALITSRKELDRIRAVLKENNLLPDLAYMVLVETGFRLNSRSRRGAAGPWQLRYRTAKAYGLVVERGNDERYDLEKSTKAAGRYIRSLIADFGAGSSFMLVLAAYNLGPTKVRSIIRKVEDPIKHRNFWYLYRTRALPPETREYVPKVIAAIIIGRNPDRFGIEAPATI
ncbi:MAG: transglycosylase SLT domain-containing protein [Acidobacteriota bacterium]|nr:transglycosylase SLT domain-containing protein [Acidobacteriota bacterium]